MEESKFKVNIMSIIIFILLLATIVVGIFFIQKLNTELDSQGKKIEELSSMIETTNELLIEQKEDNQTKKVIEQEEDADVSTETESKKTQKISGVGFNAILKNDNIEIILENQEGLWTDSDFNAPITGKSYTVKGLRKGIKKIACGNGMTDVDPEIFVLMNDGTVDTISLSNTIVKVMFGSKDPKDIQFSNSRKYL